MDSLLSQHARRRDWIEEFVKFMTKHWPNSITLWLGVLILLLPRLLCAQASWEFSPYQIEIWWLAGNSPVVSPQLLASVSAGFRERAQIVANAAWEIHESPPPLEVRGDLLLEELPPQYARLKTVFDDLSARDKLIVVRVDEDERGFVVTVRQFDTRTRLWDAVRERVTPQRDQLPFVVWDLVRQSFAPILRVERIQDSSIQARVRAGGLVVNPTENPAAVQPGDALQPILRRNDRTGEPAKTAGISLAPWSAIHVDERAEAVISGTMFSGVRYPLPSRGGVRTERLAMKMNPRLPATRLVVESKSAERQPLEGYEIFSKLPGGEEAKLLGRTDWRGGFVVPPRESTLQVLYVRSGGKLLARLPLVVGSMEKAAVRLVDDQQRLQADGLIAALHSRVTDLVARREILAARIRNLIRQGKFDEAEVLVSQFRQLETRTDLLKGLDEQQPTVRSSDKSTQARIDKMFADARKLLGKFLDPGTAEILHGEVQRAKQAPAPVPETPSPTPQEPVPPLEPTAPPPVSAPTAPAPTG